MEITKHIDLQYSNLIAWIISQGYETTDRTGTGTKKVFAKEIRWNMQQGFPLLTTKKMHWPSIVSELLWFLKGRSDLKWLLQHNNMIWLGDAYKKYEKAFYEQVPMDYPLTKEQFKEKILTDEEFSKKWGDLGPIYGAQWRNWKTNKKNLVKNGHYSNGEHKWIEEDINIDQIQQLIKGIKENPYGRRHIVNAWNPAELPQMILPPCHYSFECFVRPLSSYERGELYDKKFPIQTTQLKTVEDYNNAGIPTNGLSLVWNQRSVDTGLGLPFNIASYALLLEMLAVATKTMPDMLVGRLTDTHIYLNHIEPIQEHLNREPMELPSIKFIYNTEDPYLRNVVKEQIELCNYNSHPKINLPLSN